MADPQDRALTDQELLGIYNDKRADLSRLRPEEQQRLVTLTDPNKAAPDGESSVIEQAGRFGRNAWEMLNPKTAATGLMHLALHPIESYQGMVQQSQQAFEKAQRERDVASDIWAHRQPLGSGGGGDMLAAAAHRATAFGHNMAGVLPLIGPTAEGAGEQMVEGDIAGGLGKGVGLLAAPKLGEYVVGKPIAIGLRRIAPKVMDTALWRTRAQRLEFPNTPQRLVDEAILPKEANIQNQLTNTETKIKTDVRAFDRQRPVVRGLLPEATKEVPIQTPEGASPASLGPNNGLDATDWPVEQQGTIRQPMQSPPGRGAPPNMVDPAALARQARDFAWKEGKVADLGDVPGEDAAAIGAAERQYLSENTRPRNLEETVDQKRAYAQRSKYNNQPNAKPSPNSHANFDKGIAAANRDAAIKLQPSLEADLSREQDLIGAKTAMGYTDNRGTPLLAGGIVRHALLRPTILGGGAIALDRLGRLMANPASARAALLALLAGDTGASAGTVEGMK